MTVKVFPYGPLGSNMYVLISDACWFVIDPSCKPDAVFMSRAADELKAKELKGIIITHGHFDHLAACGLWSEKFPDVPVYIHPEDAICLKDPRKNCSLDFAGPETFDITPEDIMDLNGGVIDGLKITVLHTPGQCKGQCAIIFEDTEREDLRDVMFTGDLLFKGSIGRTDLYDGDYKEMQRSLEMLKSIEKDYTVLPGHGPSSTLNIEKATNPFL